MTQVLDYHIPAFRTIAWVSDEARAVWNPRLEQVNDAILQSTLLAVHEGRLAEERLIVHGKWHLLLKAKAKALGIEPLVQPIGDHHSSLRYFQVYFGKGEQNSVEPAVAHSSRKEWLWQAAVNSEHLREHNTLRIPEKAEKHLMWIKLLLTFGTPYCPSLVQEDQQDIQQLRRSILADYGFHEAAKWLSEIYSWPVEWSSFHGICEVRTPILKLCYDTDPLAEKHIVQIEGEGYPKEGVFGKRFPYKARSFQKITDSKSFKNGLASIQ